MTTAAPNYDYIGYQPVGNFFTPDTTQRHSLGTNLAVVDPYWGGQSLIYCSFPASTALSVGTVVVWDAAYSATGVPNTAVQGFSVGLVLNAVPSVAAVQYGWVLISGRYVAWSGASVAAAAQIGITAAGKLGAVSAGKMLLNTKVETAATTTVVKANGRTQSGSPIIQVSNTDGWFVGLPITGTGIAASSTITAIDPNNFTVTLNNNATATGAASLTGTYNDAGTNFWNVVYVNAPTCQSQIT